MLQDVRGGGGWGLARVRHIKSISKKKPNYKSILSYIQKSTASNIDLPSVESTYIDMTANGIIGKDLKILISISCVSDTILDDNVDFVTSDKSNPESPQRAPIQNQLNAPEMMEWKIVILLTFWKLNSYFLKKKIQFYFRSLKINKK